MWKRNLAGILDFFLTFFVCGYGVLEIFGNRFDAPHVVGKPLITYGSGDESYALGRWPMPLAFALVSDGSVLEVRIVFGKSSAQVANQAECNQMAA